MFQPDPTGTHFAGAGISAGRATAQMHPGAANSSFSLWAPCCPSLSLYSACCCILVPSFGGGGTEKLNVCPYVPSSLCPRKLIAMNCSLQPAHNQSKFKFSSAQEKGRCSFSVLPCSLIHSEGTRGSKMRPDCFNCYRISISYPTSNPDFSHQGIGLWPLKPVVI